MVDDRGFLNDESAAMLVQDQDCLSYPPEFAQLKLEPERFSSPTSSAYNTFHNSQDQNMPENGQVGIFMQNQSIMG